MDIDDVPEPERKQTAQVVLNNVLDAMENDLPTTCNTKAKASSSCCDSKKEVPGCCAG
ncbi:MAG: hypothetical protein ABIJ59_08790 [Pseudomonadota bacterium]